MHIFIVHCIDLYFRRIRAKIDIIITIMYKKDN